MLFVFSTLGGFALFELFKSVRIHPMQYVLLGPAYQLVAFDGPCLTAGEQVRRQ